MKLEYDRSTKYIQVLITAAADATATIAIHLPARDTAKQYQEAWLTDIPAGSSYAVAFDTTGDACADVTVKSAADPASIVYCAMDGSYGKAQVNGHADGTAIHLGPAFVAVPDPAPAPEPAPAQAQQVQSFGG
jgi:hypothetical protein